MQRLTHHLPSPLALVVSVLGHAVVLAALANIPVVASAHAEELLQPRPGTQARVTRADAEQARIFAVLHGPRYADDAENISAAESFADRTLKLYAARAAAHQAVAAAKPVAQPTLASAAAPLN
jgi:hypothetical protein